MSVLCSALDSSCGFRGPLTTEAANTHSWPQRQSAARDMMSVDATSVPAMYNMGPFNSGSPSSQDATSPSPMYGLRRRSRLSHLDCTGQVFDCQQRTHTEATTLTPRSKESGTEWDPIPSSSAAIFQSTTCQRRESDSDSLLSFQSPNGGRLQGVRSPEKGICRRRASRKSTSSLSSSPGKARHTAVQPYHNKFSEEINKELYNWLNSHLEFPYPTDEQKVELCHRTGLTKLQLRYWFTNVRRRTLPSIIQARNEERQKKGLAAIKSRSRWESDPRQPTVKETSGRQSKPQGDMLPMYGRLDSGFGDQANSLWSYSLKPMPATSDATDKTASSGTPMAYCPIATPTQPMWHTASVAVAHVRNAIYTGMPYDAAAAAAGNYSSPSAQTPSTAGGMPGNSSASHLGPIVLTPASPHPQLSFQAHTQALYSPMEILPTVQQMGIPYSAQLQPHTSPTFTTTAP